MRITPYIKENANSIPQRVKVSSSINWHHLKRFLTYKYENLDPLLWFKIKASLLSFTKLIDWITIPYFVLCFDALCNMFLLNIFGSYYSTFRRNIFGSYYSVHLFSIYLISAIDNTLDKIYPASLTGSHVLNFFLTGWSISCFALPICYFQAKTIEWCILTDDIQKLMVNHQINNMYDKEIPVTCFWGVSGNTYSIMELVKVAGAYNTSIILKSYACTDLTNNDRQILHVLENYKVHDNKLPQDVIKKILEFLKPNNKYRFNSSFLNFHHFLSRRAQFDMWDDNIFETSMNEYLAKNSLADYYEELLKENKKKKNKKSDVCIANFTTPLGKDRKDIARPMLTAYSASANNIAKEESDIIDLELGLPRARASRLLRIS